MFDKNSISNLYTRQGLSSSEIAKKYGVSVWRIISYMRRNNIKRRSPAETLKIQFEKKNLSFNKKSKLIPKERDLLLSGLSLYWAEGSKLNRHAVDFTNCNKKMLAIFMRVLRKIYRVDEKRIRIYIYCYSNQNPDFLINYWSDKLKVSKNQFSKPYVRTDYRLDKTDRMPFGLVHIRYYDVKLLRQILKDIDIIADSL